MTPPQSPLSRLRPPLSHFLSLCDLITPPLISFDRHQLIRGQHLDGSHDNRQDQIYQALKGGSRSLGEVGGCNEKFPEIDSFDGERRTEAWMVLHCHCFLFLCAYSLCVCGCVCVTSFPLSPQPIPRTQWERVEWRAVLLFMYKRERVQGCRWSYFLTVPKDSKQPQQWPWLINTFIRIIVFFLQRWKKLKCAEQSIDLLLKAL